MITIVKSHIPSVQLKELYRLIKDARTMCVEPDWVNDIEEDLDEALKLLESIISINNMTPHNRLMARLAR